MTTWQVLGQFVRVRAGQADGPVPHGLPPGQRSAGWSGVMVFNVVAVAIVLVLVVVALL